MRRLVDIMWAVQDPLNTISLDAEKAFDRVEWQYLFTTLKCFGLSKNFIKRIRPIYTHPKAAVLTNGIICPQFELGRGTGLLSFLSSPLNRWWLQSEKSPNSPVFTGQLPQTYAVCR